MWPESLQGAFKNFLNLTFNIIVDFDIIVDSRAVVRNKIERPYVFFILFFPSVNIFQNYSIISCQEIDINIIYQCYSDFIGFIQTSWCVCVYIILSHV